MVSVADCRPVARAALVTLVSVSVTVSSGSARVSLVTGKGTTTLRAPAATLTVMSTAPTSAGNAPAVVDAVPAVTCTVNVTPVGEGRLSTTSTDAGPASPVKNAGAENAIWVDAVGTDFVAAGRVTAAATIPVLARLTTPSEDRMSFLCECMVICDFRVHRP